MNQPNTEFPELSPQEWKLKVQAELGGLDYNEVLVWDSPEGIQVKPLYTRDDVEYTNSNIINTASDWKVIADFSGHPDQDFSYLYGFNLNDEQIENISRIPEYLDFFYHFKTPHETIQRTDFSKIPNLQYLGFDCLGNLVATGNWYRSENEDFHLGREMLKEKHFAKSLLVNASLYQNAGANHVQQIAIALAHGNEYLQKFGGESAEKIFFKTAVGSNYFFEIAKLRALRKLWGNIASEYGTTSDTFIYAETSLRNKSVLDIHNNLIRGGLEVSAAAQGKADAVFVYPFDAIQNGSDFSEELASKQQLLLQRESHFDKFQDPVAGGYFIENLTDLFCKNALELFKKIESDGGFLKGLFEGTIQKMISKSAEKEQAAFDEGKLVLIGVNKFRNPAEKPLELPVPVPNKTKVLIEPIFSKRLAAKLEKSL